MFSHNLRRGSWIIVLLLTVLLVAGLGSLPGAKPANAAKAAAPGQRSLGDLLNADGTVNLNSGYNGSLDTKGYTMQRGKDGKPRFVANSAQVAGDENWDTRFNLPGVNGTVNAIVISGTTAYIGGNFTLAGTVAVNNIFSWDGTTVAPLGAGISGGSNAVEAMVFIGSTLYVGGFFTTAGAITANSIATWDGTNWATLGSGTTAGVASLAVMGSTLYVGGYFTSISGVAAKYVAAWNGTNWAALGSGMNNGVLALAVNGSTLYVGGYFTTAGGSAANRIAAWDGANWSAFGTGMNNTVYALLVSGSTLYAGGDFTNAGGVAAKRVAQWNGASWSTVGIGFDGTVNAFKMIGSTLYAGGQFSSTDPNTLTNGVAQWNGTIWSVMGTGLQYNLGSRASGLALAARGSTLYVGGQFYTAGSLGAGSLAQWDGTNWSPFFSGQGVSDTIYAMAVSGSTVYVAGQFTAAGAASVVYIARWDGTSWSDLATLGTNQALYALAVNGSTLYAGGDFTQIGTVVTRGVAKWDGTSWSAVGGGVLGGVRALAFSGSTLYVGGYFSWAGANVPNTKYIAAFDGANWSSLGGGVSTGSQVSTLLVNGSTLYAGGTFTNIGGTTVSHIAAWNGTSWAALGSGMNNAVNALALKGSTLYAGGAFTTAGGNPASRVASWDGANWSTLGSGVNNIVTALLVRSGILYVGGGFTTAGGASANRIAQWDGANWSTFGSGLNGLAQALATSGTNLYIGGFFTLAGGSASSHFAVWTALPVPPTPTSTPTSTATPTFTATPCPTSFWTDVTNVSVCDKAITKTSGVSGWDSGAASSQQISSGDGYVQWTIPDTTSYVFAGLSHGDSNTDFADVDYGFYTYAAGNELDIYEDGVYQGGFTGYNAGDVLKVAVVGGVVNYYHNGTQLYSSATAPSYPLLLDAAIFTPGATIGGAQISGATGPVTTWTPTLTPVPPTVFPVNWTDKTGTSSSANTLTKSGPNSAWDAGGASDLQIISGDGYISATVADTSSYVMLGLSNGDSNVDYTDLDYGIYTYASIGQLVVYEGGNYIGSYGSYNAGDVLKIAVEGGHVKYYKNGAAFYISSATPTYPLLLDAAIFSTGGQVVNAYIAGNNLSAITAWTPTVTPTATNTPVPPTCANVVFANQLYVNTNGNTITKSIGVTGWNSGATSSTAINSGDGWVSSAISDTASFMMVGLGTSDNAGSYTAINYAVYTYANVNQLAIYESGTYRAGIAGYAAGDVIKVALEGGVVKYYKNATLLYISSVAPSYPLLLNAAIYTPGAAVSNARICGFNVAAAALPLHAPLGAVPAGKLPAAPIKTGEVPAAPVVPALGTAGGGKQRVPARPVVPAGAANTNSSVPQRPLVPPLTGHFADVPAGSSFYAYVEAAYARGILSGYADHTFRPMNATTRAQAVKVVVLAFGWPISQPDRGHFADVTGANPFFAYVETGYSHHLLGGYADGTFRPYAGVTRGQLAKLVTQAAGLAPLDPARPGFRDVPRGSSFYGYVETAQAHGLISGYADGTFRPSNGATRGQIAKIVVSAAP